MFGYKACITNRLKLAKVIYVYVALNTWLPAAIIIVSNIAILVRVYHSKTVQQKISSCIGNVNVAKGMVKEYRLTRTMVLISLMYIVLLLPLGVAQTYELFWNSVQKTEPSINTVEQLKYIEYKKGQLLRKWIRALCFFVYQLNYSINFFIYCVSNSKFRSVLYSLLPFLHRVLLKRWPASVQLSKIQATTSTSLPSIKIQETDFNMKEDS